MQSFLEFMKRVILILSSMIHSIFCNLFILRS
jgi:hypothetical protein